MTTFRAADDYVEAVLDVVEQIPSGRVMTYGQIAEVVGVGGPRQVGSVLSRYGAAVPWWRVVAASGRLPPGHEQQALAHLRAEATPVRGPASDARVDLRRARWEA